MGADVAFHIRVQPLGNEAGRGLAADFGGGSRVVPIDKMGAESGFLVWGGPPGVDDELDERGEQFGVFPGFDGLRSLS